MVKSPLLAKITAFNFYNTNRGQTPPLFSRGVVSTPINTTSPHLIGEWL